MQSELDAIKRSKQEKDDEISRIREELQLQSRRNEALAQRELELQQQLRDVRQKDSEAAKALIAQIEVCKLVVPMSVVNSYLYVQYRRSKKN